MAGSSPQAEEISTSGSRSCAMSAGNSSTSNVVYNLSASPRQSKPGPRLALVAGTRTITRDGRNIAILSFYRHYSTDTIPVQVFLRVPPAAGRKGEKEAGTPRAPPGAAAPGPC